MGKHYTPKAHLERFHAFGEQGFVWMFDKKTGRFSKAAISQVAQERDYYSQEVEAALANEVEKPGNILLAKMLGKEPLAEPERYKLSIYMLIMATRGPRFRRETMALVPSTLNEIAADVRTEITAAASDGRLSAEAARTRFEELQRVEQKHRERLPSQVLDRIRTPFCSHESAKCVFDMAWHIMRASEGHYFLTGDVPAHFFAGVGLGRTGSEFTFPISKDVALVGERSLGKCIVFEDPQLPILKEINRRIISHAERFVFSPANDDWIRAVASKSKANLNRIIWQPRAGR